MFWVAFANDRYRATAHALSGAVSCFGIPVCAIYLDQHGIIDASAKCALYRVEINSVSVGGQLNPMSQTGRQIVHQCEGALRTPVAHKPRDGQLGIRIYGGPGPNIAITELLLLVSRHILLLRIDEAPNLITLNAFEIRSFVYAKQQN